jgi:hypothetical protein
MTRINSPMSVSSQLKMKSLSPILISHPQLKLEDKIQVDLVVFERWKVYFSSKHSTTP